MDLSHISWVEVMTGKLDLLTIRSRSCARIRVLVQLRIYRALRISRDGHSGLSIILLLHYYITTIIIIIIIIIRSIILEPHSIVPPLCYADVFMV